jgi:CubicO group peptidase (beta-lactamase class C family)
MSSFLQKSILATGLMFMTFSCKPLRIPTIYDGEKFGATPIPVTPNTIAIPKGQSVLPDISTWLSKKDVAKHGTLEKFLESNNTISFLVIKGDSLIYEFYGNGNKAGEITQVFSATKVFVTSVLGIALQEGYITSLDQPIKDFLPEFNKPEFDKITLNHLVQMRSGLNYDEYGKLFQTLKFYYEKNPSSLWPGLKFKNEPGQKFVYKSVDTQLLGECIQKAVGKPFLDYFHEKLWSKLAPEDSAKWSVVSPEVGELKYYGGLNISARDLAKFGMAAVNDGKYLGNQIIPAGWLNVCDDIQCRNEEGFYCNGWWFDETTPDDHIYFGAGFGGQIVAVNEDTKTVVVRLGKNKGGTQWYPLMIKLSRQLK